MTLRIAGAGLAGLLAAHAWPQAPVFDPAPGPRAAHRAVLRFRSDAVAQLTGIEFRPVTVRKGIWFKEGFVAPSIQMANLYSRKVLRALESDRSIWNLDSAQRFIAPETLYEQLVEAVGARVQWGNACIYGDRTAPVISTAPLPAVLKGLKLHQEVQFTHKAIEVARYRVPRCDVYQSIYFPDPDTSIYRASITGDLLIVEAMQHTHAPLVEAMMHEVQQAFGIGWDIERIDRGEQRFGKIVPLDDALRKRLLFQLTQEFGVFSLGRFATWRNVLLDDVVQDIAVVRRLLRSSEYERRLHHS